MAAAVIAILRTKLPKQDERTCHTNLKHFCQYNLYGAGRTNEQLPQGETKYRCRRKTESPTTPQGQSRQDVGRNGPMASPHVTHMAMELRVVFVGFRLIYSTSASNSRDSWCMCGMVCPKARHGVYVIHGTGSMLLVSLLSGWRRLLGSDFGRKWGA